MSNNIEIKKTDTTDELTDEKIAQNKAMYDLYTRQAEAVKSQAATLAQNQQAQSDLAIAQLEQSKQEMEKDYKKEQAAAYTDYQKQINPYGVNAERLAQNGFLGSGYGESSKVRMYNAYQERVAANKSTYDSAVASYNIAIAEAKQQNSSTLAQIAYNALEQELSLLTEAQKYAVSGGTVGVVNKDNAVTGGVADTSVGVSTPVVNTATNRSSVRIRNIKDDAKASVIKAMVNGFDGKSSGKVSDTLGILVENGELSMDEAADIYDNFEMSQAGMLTEAEFNKAKRGGGRNADSTVKQSDDYDEYRRKMMENVFGNF